jgi:hypothetical protein
MISSSPRVSPSPFVAFSSVPEPRMNSKKKHIYEKKNKHIIKVFCLAMRVSRMFQFWRIPKKTEQKMPKQRYQAMRWGQRADFFFSLHLAPVGI